MARRCPHLVLTAPLAVCGSVAGHAAGYALVGAPDDLRLHGYLRYAPLFAAVCLSLVLVALGLRVAGRLRGRPAAWPLALLPPLAFGLQELIERLAAGLPPDAVLQPAVLAGLAVQLPLALLALGLARVLLSAADAIADVLAGPRASALRPALLPGLAATHRLSESALAYDRLGRAPPAR